MRFKKIWIAWAVITLTGAYLTGCSEKSAKTVKNERGETRRQGKQQSPAKKATPAVDQRLFVAVAKGNAEEVKALLDKGADVNAKDKNGWTPLHTAATKNHAAIAKLLIDKSADVNAKATWNITPLHSAAAEDSVGVAKLLIDKGAEVYARAQGDITPLHWAAAKDSAGVAKLLIDKNANICAKDQYGQTPLHHAAKENSAAVAKLLIDKGADVNAKDKNGWTPLHLAAQKNGVALAKLLLDKGADANAKTKDKYGLTPLHLAAQMNSVALAKLLLDKGAKQRKDANGLNPLHIAAATNNADVAELLLKHDAKVNVQDNGGNTPIVYALNNKGFKTARILLDHGARMSYKDWVCHAIKKHDHALLKFMTEINWNEIDAQTDIDTCLLAIRSNDTESLKLLLDAIEKYRKQKYQEQNLYIHIGRGIVSDGHGFDIAAGNGNIDMCRIIMERFPYIAYDFRIHGWMELQREQLNELKRLEACQRAPRAPGPNKIELEEKEEVVGISAKEYICSSHLAACKNKHFACARWLIEHGADVNALCDTTNNNIHMTALYYAVINDDVEFVKYLLSKGAKVQQGLVKLTKNEDIIELLDGAE